MILALNETRKTVLASRLHLVQEKSWLEGLASLLPGDAVWVEADRRIDGTALGPAVDLVYVDSDHRVVAAIAGVESREAWPTMEGAVGVLAAAPGTIRLSETEEGDRVVLEPIMVPEAAAAPAVRVRP